MKMLSLCLFLLIGSMAGCSRNRQRFVPVVVPEDSKAPSDIFGERAPYVLILDTQTGQWCKGSNDKSKSPYPLCHDLYTGKIK
jgi:hypothetical protein